MNQPRDIGTWDSKFQAWTERAKPIVRTIAEHPEIAYAPFALFLHEIENEISDATALAPSPDNTMARDDFPHYMAISALMHAASDYYDAEHSSIPHIRKANWERGLAMMEQQLSVNEHAAAAMLTNFFSVKGR